jgi:hypothetical protein
MTALSSVFCPLTFIVDTLKFRNQTTVQLEALHSSYVQRISKKKPSLIVCGGVEENYPGRESNIQHDHHSLANSILLASLY